MLSPGRIKREIFSSGDEDDEAEGDERIDPKDERIELLEFERNLMLDTFSDDVLFVLARGLGLERLMLHHFHLYADEKLLVFVINTNQNDEAFFLSRLRSCKCVPKIITSDVSIKDREALYMEGGIQFITTRILMVDLLQDRVPVKNVAGIIVHRAHQLLTSYQESFILRLYREKKANGFVKAFTDNPGLLNSIGVLQRLVKQLYIRRVRLVPRFDVDVKRILDLRSAKSIELRCDLPFPMRRMQSALVDIIRTCLKELKQSSAGVESGTEEEIIHPSAGLTATPLEIQLKAQQSQLSEKQQRLLSDLKQLRTLLYEAEELDPTVVFRNLTAIRADKDQEQLIKNNSGWLFTQTASKLSAEAESICKVKVGDDFTFLEPPKWSALKTALTEVRGLNKARKSQNVKVAPALIIASGNEVCMQLRDLIKLGPNFLKYKKMLDVADDLAIKKPASGPPTESLWDPAQTVLFASKIEGEKRSDIVTSVRTSQKEAARKGKKRRRLAEEEIRKKKLGSSDKQTKLVQFGIVHYKRCKKEQEHVEEAGPSSKTVEEDKNEEEEEAESSFEEEAADPLLVIFPQGERYNLLRQLDTLQPNEVILYHSDLVTMRILEMYKACNPEIDLRIYILIYGESNEEERYLCSLRREQLAFEHLVREQGTLMAPREYETAREPPPRLNLTQSTRVSGGRVEETAEDNPKVIIDMREFNSELPTILYKRGTDLLPATLEVGDYILSPDIAVERKALDDLTQSLHSGRVFKQVEQMLRHYKKVMLLIEANAKDTNKKINGGPFQGELSRRCRETRSLFTILVRKYPAMNVVWSLAPLYSAEMFEELKLNEANPNLENALAIKSDTDNTLDDSPSGGSLEEQGSPTKGKPGVRLNPVLQRQLNRLPYLAPGDVTRMMKSEKATCLLDVINADTETVGQVLHNDTQAKSLRHFFDCNFQLVTLGV